MKLHRIYSVLFSIWRAKRIEAFRKRFQPTDETTVLDVGGYAEYWKPLLPIEPRVTLLNLDPNVLRYPRPDNMTARVGDATAMPEIADGAYDVAHSNSVIEHLYNWEAQRKFAEEVRRVGKAVWVQTPAAEFFFEPHYLTPFVHWLPAGARKRIVRNGTVTGLISRPSPDRAREMVDEIRLLTRREMEALFPDCEILVERFMGWPKSYVAVRGGLRSTRQAI